MLAVWLGAVPLATCWLWRLVFVTSLRAGAASLLSRASPLLLLTDCLYGSLLSAGIIFTILAVSSLREHLRAVRPRAPDSAAVSPGLRAAPRADARRVSHRTRVSCASRCRSWSWWRASLPH